MSQAAVFPTGTVTFLFTDIEGSTRLWETQPQAMQTALERHDQLLRQAVANAGGIVFKTVGDAFCAAFAQAPAALEAARQAQAALRAEPWSLETPLRVRMALHTGLAQERDNDYFGPVLNRVARLLSAGHGGQTLLSIVTHELTRDTLPDGVSLVDLGAHRLKDLERPEHVFQLTGTGLPDHFPPLRSLDSISNNLPRQVTSFIGREKAIAEVTALLAGTRLLTLTGAGGSGKTRLSLQVAADVIEQYPDGAWLVEMAPLADPSLVPQTVAATLGVREQAGQSMTQTLSAHLKDRTLLLVLDNCEHLLSACAQFVASLIRACPNVKVLTTSREALGIGGEQTYRVPSLSLPDPKASKGATATADSLSQFEAVRLFIERAQAVKGDFAVTNANAPALAQICYRLDGIPLALELAAARARSLAVEQINDRLDSRFRLLTGGDKAALPRQQTLRALVDWSYDLLTESEKTLLARLSVVAGGWTLEAAEQVCTGEGVEAWEALDLLLSLSDKSLVSYEEKEGQGRYRLLETIRQYAAEKLEASGAEAAEEAREQHQRFYLSLAEAAEPQLVGQDQALWLDRLESEHDNLRAAMEARNKAVVLHIAGSLLKFWQVRGYFSEGRARLSDALGEALKEGDKGEDVNSSARAKGLQAAGNLAPAQSDYVSARALCQESLEMFRALGDKGGSALSLNNLGRVAQEQGDYASARALYQESLGIRRELGDRGGIADSLNGLGLVAYSQGDYASARALYQESLAIARELGDRGGIACVLEGFAALCAAEGQADQAALLWGSTERLREEMDAPLPPAERARYARDVASARQALGEEAFLAAWEAGRAMPLEQTMAVALKAPVTAP